MTISVAPALAGNGRAIAYMILAILCFSMMDATVKALSPIVGTVPALWARYAGQMALVLVLIAPRFRSVMRTKYLKLQFFRSVLLMGATGCFFLGLAHIGLTEASAIMNVNPVLVTLGAALFLGEKLGMRRVFGILAAMVGALIVIRPGSDVFSPYALLPLGAALCYSSYALLTRLVGRDEDVWTSLFYTGLVGTLILSIAVPFAWQPPGAKGWLLMGMIAAFGTAGQMSLIRALTAGEAGMLAPYAYLGLVFAAFWGLLFFAEVPDFWTVVGALVIAAAGLYVWQRETFARQSAPLTPPDHSGQET
ncbi:Pseudopaline exporter CntI (plasmid) [Pseudoseohaeicola sp. NH-UV-7]|uniref:DMT family transporter n=1 Tax=unclassified Sulfitobacter TaxID=196795 RepID=UPI00196359EA|nr:DMT family transporter [Sulfitobacter sp. JL08]